MLRRNGGAEGWHTSPAQARAARDHASASYGTPKQAEPTLLQHGRSLLLHALEAAETRKIFAFFMINFCFMLVEVSYGMWTNSLGLISDAAHMLFDCTALLLGLAASYVARWRPNEVFTYGYARVEVLAGFTNALFLLFIAVYIFLEALERLLEPPHVGTAAPPPIPPSAGSAVRHKARGRVGADPDALFTVSVLGLLVNLVGLGFFWEQHAAVCTDPGCSVECASLLFPMPRKTRKP